MGDIIHERSPIGQASGPRKKYNSKYTLYISMHFILNNLPNKKCHKVCTYLLSACNSTKMYVLTMYVAAMDQRLHFWPPGGQFLYFYARFINIMQFYPLVMFDPFLYLLWIKMVPSDHTLSVSPIQYSIVHYTTAQCITVYCSTSPASQVASMLRNSQCQPESMSARVNVSQSQ